MNKLFTEFENENALRTYPFASGCTVTDTDGHKIGEGIIIDAALYPVNATGTIYLSKIAADGTLSISDDTGVIMTGELERDNSDLELYDTTELKRHTGTLVASSAEALTTLINVYADRNFKATATTFASSCIFSVVNDGITSLNVGGTGMVDGEIKFTNASDDSIRVSTDGSNLRFDVIPPFDPKQLTSIQHIYCIVDGKTPFRILKIPFDIGSSDSDYGLGNTVAVYLDNIERQDICSNAHRENALEMVDVCEECESSSCPSEPEEPVEIPEIYQVEVVDIPNGADSAFYLAVPNFLGYDNPLSLTLEDGLPVPKLDIKVDVNADNLDKLLDTMTSKGAVLQVPGLAPIL